MNPPHRFSDTGAPLDDRIGHLVGTTRLAILDVEDWKPPLTPDAYASLRAIDEVLTRIHLARVERSRW